MQIIEIAYHRMREIVAILERELEDADMVLYYAREPMEGIPMPDGNVVHHAYIVERAQKALAQAKAALAGIQILAYEQGVVDSLPEAS